MSYWYYEAPDGRQFCYSKEPSFRCPIGTAERLGDVLEQACEYVDIDPDYLLRRMKHGSYRRRDQDGHLTDRCDACGHKLERLGFRCWVQTPSEDESTRRIAQRIGFEATKTVRSFYADTKKEAKTWAVEEYKQAKAAAAERTPVR